MIILSKNLVIVESPTKAKTIKKFLGRNYSVQASMGHLRDLPKSRLGIDIDNNFEPEYIKVRGKAKLINNLKKEADKAEKVYLATDPDREGEAISWHLQYLLGLDQAQKNRIEFHEITKKEVLNSINKPREVDMKLVNSQQARRVIDRLVGYEISPILWKRIKSGLSAGRVQSVALKLIIDRQRKINEFEPEEYWTISAFHEIDKIKFESEYYGNIINDKKLKIELKNKEETLKVLNSLSKDGFKVLDIKNTKKKKNPPKPYTTSTLQQDSSNKLGFSTKKTMSIAQQLFEGVETDEGSVGLITYMRTDSTRISSEIVNSALEYIKENYGKEYASSGRTFSKKQKGSQDAHEAIRPTSILMTPQRIHKYLTEDQFKLYRLIWTRIIQSQMKEYEYMSTSILFENNSNLFKSNGVQTIFEGFNLISLGKQTQNFLPQLKVNEKISAVKIENNQHFTNPPPNYTEASLVKELEENGIGRPSTYSSTINSVLSRNYATIEDRKIIPTKLGFTVCDFLEENFDDIINVEFTASLENKLDDVASDEIEWKTLVSNFYKDLEKDLKETKKDDKDYKVKNEQINEKCPKCGSNLAIKHGKNGSFIGCTNFPNCDYTRSIKKTTGVKCPICGGEILEKVSKKGKRFYGCENYPDCTYSVWDEPIKEKCPNCGYPLLHKKNRKENKIYCDNCGYEKM